MADFDCKVQITASRQQQKEVMLCPHCTQKRGPSASIVNLKRLRCRLREGCAYLCAETSLLRTTQINDTPFFFLSQADNHSSLGARSFFLASSHCSTDLVASHCQHHKAGRSHGINQCHLFTRKSLESIYGVIVHERDIALSMMIARCSQNQTRNSLVVVAPPDVRTTLTSAQKRSSAQASPGLLTVG